MTQAEQGIEDLKDKVDSLVIIPNERLKHATDQKITFANAFAIEMMCCGRQCRVFLT